MAGREPDGSGQSGNWSSGIMRLVSRIGVFGTVSLLTLGVLLITYAVVTLGYWLDGVDRSGQPVLAAMPLVMPVLIGWPVIFVLVRAIARTRDAERQHVQSEGKYRDLIEGSLQGVCVHRNLIPIFVNNSFAQIFGFDNAEELRSLPSLLVVFAPEERPIIAQNATRRLKGETLPASFERRALRKDGTVIWVQTMIKSILWDGQPALQLIVIDITQRKTIDQMKNDFISTVSHELRTPLTSIAGSLGLIAAGMAGGISPDAKRLIDIASNNSDRLVRLINDILDIEKIESGRMEIEFFPIQVWSLIEMAAEASRGFAERYGIAIDVATAPAEARIIGGIDQLMQVFANLLSNAIKHSPMRGSIQIGAERRGEYIRFFVTDHGRGIPEDFRHRIFSKFTRATDENAQRGAGTGLGLAICKALVEKHGGIIGFTTEVGAGSTFYFDLPEHRIDEPHERVGSPSPRR
jgi:PAS domain S-box-containing protein